MKHIFLNLKRFDVPVCYGGVNRIAPPKDWGGYIVHGTQDALKRYDPSEVEFVQYFPEAHLLSAVDARCEGSPVQVGCQGVYRMNTAVGGTGGIPVVYGGGLKVDNAEMLASILEIDGGLIALTRFQGEIGFYPDEYVEIIRTYLGK